MIDCDLWVVSDPPLISMERKMPDLAEEVRLAELSADFDRRLESFKTGGIRDRVEGVMSARGRIKRPLKAGATY